MEPGEARMSVGEQEGPHERSEWSYWGRDGSQRAAGIRVQEMMGPGEAWEGLASFLDSVWLGGFW